MTRIWKVLARRVRNGGVTESNLEQVARDLGEGAHPRTLQEALAVLEELGVARWEGLAGQRRLQLGTGTGRRLEESPRFVERSRLRSDFLRVRRAFGRRTVCLEPEESAVREPACASGQNR